MLEILCFLVYSTFGIGAESSVEAVEGTLRSVSKTPKRIYFFVDSNVVSLRCLFLDVLDARATTTDCSGPDYPEKPKVEGHRCAPQDNHVIESSLCAALAYLTATALPYSRENAFGFLRHYSTPGWRPCPQVAPTSACLEI
jgi:hypothetical protein